MGDMQKLLHLQSNRMQDSAFLSNVEIGSSESVRVESATK